MENAAGLRIIYPTDEPEPPKHGRPPSAWRRVLARIADASSLDLRSLAAMRVALALVVLGDLVLRARHLSAHYTDAGIVPRALAMAYYDTPWKFSLHFMSGERPFQAGLFLLAGALALMLLAGYRTRLATIGTWLLLVSLHNRNPAVLQGGDILLRLAFFWAMFLPWGRRCAVDALSPHPPAGSPRHASAGAAAYLLQIAFVYLFAGLVKLRDADWSGGTAILEALRLEVYAKPMGLLLLKFPDALKALTYGVLGLELLVPILILSPVFIRQARAAAAFGLLAFHAGLFFTMELGPFPWVGIATAVGLLPGAFWDRAAAFLRKEKKAHVRVYYDSGCGFCRRAAAWAATFLLLPAAVFTAERRAGPWAVADHSGRRLMGAEALAAVAGASPLTFFLAPVLRLKAAEGAWRRLRRRFPHRKAKEPGTPRKSGPGAPFRAAQALAGVLIVYVLAWNIGAHGVGKEGLPKAWQAPAYLFHLDQWWYMFCPPGASDGWYILAGTRADGTKVDLARGGAPVSYEKPRFVSETYDGERWRKYLMNLSGENYGHYRPYLASHLCRRWNGSRGPEDRLASVEIVFMRASVFGSGHYPLTLAGQACP
jgi:hypothetical protein